ncbi:hypothetical protein LEP1GSC202_0378 [Leptospira yanagawae serovar Saopaulo str. Sao Paulo = ATCC 700523]|uniref:Uncharacterized protein n=1 Tax=Leptospira yanagawae serovar Saopaulo str. Sao Paulo = ATCC 700523 TaxID=1249483 RepID=A0A5E8HHH0_9LEPT|nr:hypothetical protein [Leptospira yanagawae]EOQ90774.1 hypothetical protein LEP1GSC202_0378 [Leptospira yanagawae serovar Saopaulo str. Sao Paulo = ATCC 700523]
MKELLKILIISISTTFCSFNSKNTYYTIIDPTTQAFGEIEPKIDDFKELPYLAKVEVLTKEPIRKGVFNFHKISYLGKIYYIDSIYLSKKTEPPFKEYWLTQQPIREFTINENDIFNNTRKKYNFFGQPMTIDWWYPEKPWISSVHSIDCSGKKIKLILVVIISSRIEGKVVKLIFSSKNDIIDYDHLLEYSASTLDNNQINLEEIKYPRKHNKCFEE